jgi:hypothetical protein
MENYFIYILQLLESKEHETNIEMKDQKIMNFTRDLNRKEGAKIKFIFKWKAVSQEK